MFYYVAYLSYIQIFAFKDGLDIALIVVRG
jgi:hypothetical protein